MVTSISSDKISTAYYTAFFYSEYMFRKIMCCRPKLLEDIGKLKHLLERMIESSGIDFKGVDQSYLLDRLVEYLAFFHSDEYNCNVFAGAIHQRYQARLNAIDDGQIQRLLEMLKSEKKDHDVFYTIIDDLIRLSLKFGIYVSHLDSFKNYEIDRIKDGDSAYLLKHVFFKDFESFGLNCNFVDFDEAIYNGECEYGLLPQSDESLTPEDAICESEDYFKSRSLKVYIDINHKNFDLQTAFDCVSSIIIASKFSEMEEIISNYGQCKSFVNMYFESALFRFKKDEFIGKLLGILIYDEKMGCSSSIKDLLLEVWGKYGLKVKNECNEEACRADCVNIDICSRTASRLYDVADRSIASGKIITSKNTFCTGTG